MLAPQGTVQKTPLPEHKENIRKQKEASIVRTLPKFPRKKMERCEYLDKHILAMSGSPTCGIPHVPVQRLFNIYKQDDLQHIYNNLAKCHDNYWATMARQKPPTFTTPPQSSPSQHPSVHPTNDLPPPSPQQTQNDGDQVLIDVIKNAKSREVPKNSSQDVRKKRAKFPPKYLEHLHRLTRVNL